MFPTSQRLDALPASSISPDDFDDILAAGAQARLLRAESVPQIGETADEAADLARAPIRAASANVPTLSRSSMRARCDAHIGCKPSLVVPCEQSLEDLALPRTEGSGALNRLGDVDSCEGGGVDGHPLGFPLRDGVLMGDSHIREVSRAAGKQRIAAQPLQLQLRGGAARIAAHFEDAKLLPVRLFQPMPVAAAANAVKPVGQRSGHQILKERPEPVEIARAVKFARRKDLKRDAVVFRADFT